MLHSGQILHQLNPLQLFKVLWLLLAYVLNAVVLLSVCTFYTGRFIMFSLITNIYNKKTKGPTLMEFFTATGKLKTFF